MAPESGLTGLLSDSPRYRRHEHDLVPLPQRHVERLQVPRVGLIVEAEHVGPELSRVLAEVEPERGGREERFLDRVGKGRGLDAEAFRAHDEVEHGGKDDVDGDSSGHGYTTAALTDSTGGR